jgi:cystathionine beta-synthase
LAAKQSPEKIDILRDVGAEVIVCTTNVPPEDPKSYYSVAKKLNKEIPNSFYPNQYDNTSNAQAHYETTGPEIWEQTEGKLTYYAAGVGTGGSMCGTAKYLKEQNPAIRTIGIDTYGSVFKKYKETGEFDEKEVYPYLTEGIGEDILPENVDFNMIDEFVKVTDKDGAIMTRRLAREEGLFIGWSCGSAVYGALEYASKVMKEDDLMVIILPDHGTRYLGKIYNDNWMKDHGFLESEDYKITAKDIIEQKNGHDQLFTIQKDMKVGDVVKVLNTQGISQIPVVDQDHFVGSVTDGKILNHFFEDPGLKDKPVSEIMDPPLTFVGMDNTIDVLTSMISHENQALLVRDHLDKVHILTQHDLLMAMTK